MISICQVVCKVSVGVYFFYLSYFLTNYIFAILKVRKNISNTIDILVLDNKKVF